MQKKIKFFFIFIKLRVLARVWCTKISNWIMAWCSTTTTENVRGHQIYFRNFASKTRVRNKLGVWVRITRPPIFFWFSNFFLLFSRRRKTDFFDYEKKTDFSRHETVAGGDIGGERDGRAQCSVTACRGVCWGTQYLRRC